MDTRIMLRFARWFIAASLAAPLWAGAAFEACLDHFPNKQVPVVQVQGLQARDLCFDSFAVLHSGKTKTPIYVVERLSRERLIDGSDLKRCSRFYEDARIPGKERASLSDYKDSGFDRGHMAPARDMPNQNAMDQSCSLANIVPQARKHNQRLWNKIEQDTRKYVMRAKGDVYVFTGPWYGGTKQTIGSGEVWVPSNIWKLIYDAETGKAWVHWTENKDGEQMNPPISAQEFIARMAWHYEHILSSRVVDDRALHSKTEVAAQSVRHGQLVNANPPSPLDARRDGRQSKPNECGAKTKCGEMTSCEEAMFYLRCGVKSLDNDRDGIPCESLCGKVRN